MGIINALPTVSAYFLIYFIKILKSYSLLVLSAKIISVNILTCLCTLNKLTSRSIFNISVSYPLTFVLFPRTFIVLISKVRLSFTFSSLFQNNI